MVVHGLIIFKPHISVVPQCSGGDRSLTVHDRLFVVNDRSSVVHDRWSVVHDRWSVVHDKWLVVHDRWSVVHDRWSVVHLNLNNYIVRSYREIIVVTNTAARRTNKA